MVLDRARVNRGAINDKFFTSPVHQIELLNVALNENCVICQNCNDSTYFLIDEIIKYLPFSYPNYRHGTLILLNPFDKHDFDSSKILIDAKENVTVKSLDDIDFDGNNELFSNFGLVLLPNFEISKFEEGQLTLLKRLIDNEQKSDIRPRIVVLTCCLSDINNLSLIDQHLNLLQKLFENFRICVDSSLLSSDMSLENVDSKFEILSCALPQHSEHQGRLIKRIERVLQSLKAYLSYARNIDENEMILSWRIYHSLKIVLAEVGSLGCFCISDNFVDQLQQRYQLDGSFVKTCLDRIYQLILAYQNEYVFGIDGVNECVCNGIQNLSTKLQIFAPTIKQNLISSAIEKGFDVFLKASDVPDPSSPNRPKPTSRNKPPPSTIKSSSDTEFSEDDLLSFAQGHITQDEFLKKKFTKQKTRLTKDKRRNLNTDCLIDILKGKKLSALVFTGRKRPFYGFIFSYIFEEFCRYEANLSFLNVSHVNSVVRSDSGIDKISKMMMKHESDALKSFALRKINLIFSPTVNNQSNFDISSVNLICKMFTQTSNQQICYGDWIGMRKFCQNSNALLLFVCSQPFYSQIYNQLNDFKSCETLLSEKIPFHQISRLIENSEDDDDDDVTSLSLEGYDRLRAKDAIRVINRFCSSLPTDCFTRLTPVFKIDRQNIDRRDSFRVKLILPNDFCRMETSAWKPNLLSACRDVCLKMCLQLAKQKHFHPNWNEVSFDQWCRNERQYDAVVNNTTPSEQKNAPTTKFYDKKVPSCFQNRDCLLDAPLSTNNGDENDVDDKNVFTKENLDANNSDDAKLFEKSEDDIEVIDPMMANKSFYLYRIRIDAIKADPKVNKNLEERCQAVIDSINLTSKVELSFLTHDKMPKLPDFVVSQKNCAVNVRVYELTEVGKRTIQFSSEELHSILKYHRYIFKNVLNFDAKSLINFEPFKSKFQSFICPLVRRTALDDPHDKRCFTDEDENCFEIDFHSIEKILTEDAEVCHDQSRPCYGRPDRFVFDREKFTDCVLSRNYTSYWTNDFFYIVNIRDDLSPASKFPSDDHDSFVSYYLDKYSISLTNIANQPLLDVDSLCLKSSSNHLSPSKRQHRSSNLIENGGDAEEEPHKLWFIPELCTVHPIPASHWNQVLFLPGIFNRLTHLSNCEELRLSINSNLGLPAESPLDGYKLGTFKLTGEPDRPFERPTHVEGRPLDMLDILNCVTSANACDVFSYEKLETLGDAYLKFVVTLHYISNFKTISEGKLTFSRSKCISNCNLYNCGKFLSEFVIFEKFDPYENWLPPCYVEHSMDESSQPAEIENNHKVVVQGIRRSRHKNKRYKNYANCKISLRNQHVLNDKVISDVVEALIGMYLVTFGVETAARLVKDFFGINASLKYNGQVKRESDFVISIFDHFNMKHLEAIIRHRFENKTLLMQSLYHQSCSIFSENVLKAVDDDCNRDGVRIVESYQTFEVLGDAIIDFLITKWLFENEKLDSPGVLTDLRSAVVNNNVFTCLALFFDLHKYVLSSSPSLYKSLQTCIANHELTKNEPISLHAENLDKLEKSPPIFLGDIFESLIGSVFLDSGCDIHQTSIVLKHLIGPVLREIETQDIMAFQSPVRKLIESFPDVVRFLAPERTVDGMVSVVVNVVGHAQFTGVGKNNRLAKNDAARKALQTIQNSNS